MDVLEKLNRRFGSWYESLFGGGSSEADLRPRDILRRILAAMEDGRREGLDGQVYVPNHYTLDIAVTDDDERDYLRAFLDADELAAAVGRHARQHSYHMRGGLAFQINEIKAPAIEDGGADRVRVRCRFDATVPEDTAALTPPEDVDDARHAAPPVSPRPLDDYEENDEEPGTVPAVALGSLSVREPGGKTEAYPLTARGIQIGRSRQAGNDIVLAGDGMVSKKHARIEYAGGDWVLSDLGSTNGTFVNDVMIGESHALQSGDEVRVGRTQVRFDAAGSARRPSPPAPPPRDASAPVLRSLRLVHARGEVFPIASEMTVGRALTSDVLLTEEGVAPRHARITVQGDQVTVEDLNTSGGTFVNGERIPAHSAVALYDGDAVAFGKAALRLERGAGPR